MNACDADSLAVMPARYWLILGENGTWLASFHHWRHAIGFIERHEPRGRLKEVRVLACAHCDDGTCPACKGW